MRTPAMADPRQTSPGSAERIPVARPWINDDDVAAVAEATAQGWGANAYAYQNRFESAFAAHCGRSHALALPSCTSGLHLILAALGVGPGDEVVVPDVTWIASVAPVAYVGATPVFADVDPHSLCMTPSSLSAVIGPRTKAAIVVDLYGDMPDWDGLDAVARRHGIHLIEDAAEAIGARYRGRPAGAFGTASAFSFHGSKAMTTGEGGMLLLDDPGLLDRCRRLSDHGRAPGDTTFRNEEIGFKYRMSSMQAALGLSQLARIDAIAAAKRRIFDRYRGRLGGVQSIGLNRSSTPGIENAYWMVTAHLDPATGLTKQRLGSELRQLGIDTRPAFDPLSNIPAFAASPGAIRARGTNRMAYAVTPYAINLPSGPALDEGAIDRVCDAVIEIVRRAADR